MQQAVPGSSSGTPGTSGPGGTGASGATGRATAARGAADAPDDTGATDAPDAAGDLGGLSPGIRDTLGRLASSIASAVDTRVQLVALEFAEERERAKDRLVLMATAAVAAAFALLSANVLLVVLLWDRLGWITLALLTVAWGAVALVAAQRMRESARREKRPFDATLGEFERDRAWIAERVGRGRP